MSAVMSLAANSLVITSLALCENQIGTSPITSTMTKVAKEYVVNNPPMLKDRVVCCPTIVLDVIGCTQYSR